MVEVLVWMLITTSYGVKNSGNVNLIATFKTVEQCEHVKKHVPKANGDVLATCVQANILVPR